MRSFEKFSYCPNWATALTTEKKVLNKVPEINRFANQKLESERRRQVGDRQDQPTFDCRIAVDREFQKLNLGKDERLATLGAQRVQEFLDASPKIRMNVESVKDRQPFALPLAAFLDLAPFFIDGVDLAADEVGGKHGI